MWKTPGKLSLCNSHYKKYGKSSNRIMKETNTRSVVKTLTWRILASIDTIIISFFITGNITKAISIGAAEIFSKLLLYYIHERIWLRISKSNPNTRLRSLFKSVTWRMIGTLDTIFISFLIISFGPSKEIIEQPFQKALSIGTIELFTKIILFYVHERIWNRIGFGKKNRMK